MNKNAKKWVKALRSGKYKQGKSRLLEPSGDRFCCLGVACDLATKAGVVERDDWACMALLPPPVVRWLGLQNASGTFGAGLSALTELNDGGKTFKQIAKIVESEPDGLFHD